MPGEKAFIKYLLEGGDPEVLQAHLAKRSPEFITGEKNINFKIALKNGEFVAQENELGAVAVQINGDKGQTSLVETIKEQGRNYMLDRLQIISPKYALNHLPKGKFGEKYKRLKAYAEKGRSGFFCMTTGLGGFETFVLAGEPNDEKLWMLTVLHESGHALNIINDYLESDQGNPISVSKTEREGWAKALELARVIKEKTGVALLSIFGSRKELKRVIYSTLLGYRAAYAETDQDDIADSKKLFDKGTLDRL